MKKAIFLDRDGTINIDGGYVYEIEKFQFIPGVIDALKILSNMEFVLVVITNQSGIARGYYSEDEYHALNQWMIATLSKEEIHIAEVYYCPHHPDGVISKYKQDCRCRKPKLGMFYEAINKYNLDIDNSYAIGDKLRDLEIVKSTGCKGILVGRNESEEAIERIKETVDSKIQYAESLKEAALIIEAMEWRKKV